MADAITRARIAYHYHVFHHGCTHCAKRSELWRAWMTAIEEKRAKA